MAGASFRRCKGLPRSHFLNGSDKTEVGDSVERSQLNMAPATGQATMNFPLFPRRSFSVQSELRSGNAWKEMGEKVWAGCVPERSRSWFEW